MLSGDEGPRHRGGGLLAERTLDDAPARDIVTE